MKSRTRSHLEPAPVIETLERFKKQNPHPKTELNYTTPFQLLLAVMLSAQTTDVSVNRSLAPLIAQGLTPKSLLAMGEEKFLAAIRTIGLAPTKARNAMKMAQKILDEFRGEIPSSRVDLESLPGVGTKTASVVLAEIFRQPELAVDTHVFRVSKRLGWQDEKSPEKSVPVLLKKIPQNYLPEAHHWLILHGRYVCKAKAPLCERCFLADLCPKIIGRN